VPTYADLTAKLLVDASQFFKTIGSSNPDVADQMNENAGVFEQMAGLISNQPEGEINGKTHAELAGKLLTDAAQFFRTIGEQNEDIKDNLLENAQLFDEVGQQVAQNPQAELPEGPAEGEA
jgi:hypothetical protein